METTEVMVLVNILLTGVVGLLSSTKFRCRCGHGKGMTMAPKDAPMSPGSVGEVTPRGVQARAPIPGISQTPQVTQVPGPTLPVPALSLPSLSSLQSLQVEDLK